MALPSSTQPDNVSSEAYVLRSGSWLAAPCGVGLVRPPTRQVAAVRGRLGYVLQSVDARPLSEALCASVTDALVQTYYAAPGEIAPALQEALLAANEALFDHNVRADMTARLLLGISCLAVQGNNLYLARLGPACAWVFSEGALTQFPAQSLWRQDSAQRKANELDREPPAGVRLDVEPELLRIELASQSLVVLLSQELQQRAKPTALLRALGGDDPDQTRARLHRMNQGQDLAVLAVGWEGGAMEPEIAPLAPEANAAPSETAAPGALAATVMMKQAMSVPREERPVSVDVTPEPIEDAITNVEPPSAGAPPAAAPASSAPLPPMPDPMPATDPEWDDEDDDAWAEDGDELADEPAVVTEPTPAATGPREHIDFVSRAESVAQDAGRVLQHGARRLRDGAEDALLKVLPDRLPERPDPEAARMPTISPASQSLVMIALLLPLLVLFTVIMVRVQHGREIEGRRGSIRQAVMSEYDQAVKAGSPALRADGLQRTIELVDAGLAILPQDEVLVDLKMRATLKLDEVDQVERLYHFKRLDSYTVGGTVLNEPSRIVIHDKDALVLNKGAGQVHGYTLSDVGDAVSSRADTPVLLRTGERRGGTEVAELVDMAWLAPTGSRTTPDLVVLDRGGTLWTWRNGAFEAAPVADSDTWLKPVAIGAFMGNLYVLDPLAGRILKYLPNNDAYTTPPHPYLNPTVTVDMLGAVDMAIDGNVYVLFADGTIHKFFDGEEQPFPMTGLPSKMRNPTSIFVSGAQEPQAEGWVYVTDRGNERIVQFDKEGNYVRSFKANTSEPYMTALGGLFVDETSQRMFMFSERQFTLVSLPPLPGR